MVSIEESIPQKSEAFLNGQDIFYIQFNEINFYIEDENQENLYFVIFSKLFSNVNFKKIFPLRGKSNVLRKADYNKDIKTKIFIVDKDFDDLLGKKILQSNLFYLEQYSIENYLINYNSLKEYVIEEQPKIKSREIQKRLMKAPRKTVAI